MNAEGSYKPSKEEIQKAENTMRNHLKGHQVGESMRRERDLKLVFNKLQKARDSFKNEVQDATRQFSWSEIGAIAGAGYGETGNDRPYEEILSYYPPELAEEVKKAKEIRLEILKKLTELDGFFKLD